MRKKYTAILCISLAVLVICGTAVIKRAADSRRAALQYEELSGEYVSAAPDAPPPDTAPAVTDVPATSSAG